MSLATVGSGGAIASTSNHESWLTLNRGRTWRRIPSTPTVSWLTPRFGLSTRSYSIGNRSALALRLTRDGGRSWQRLSDPCQKVLTFAGFGEVVTQKHWWVACLGEPGAGNEDKAIFRSRDGGRTWEPGAATTLISGVRQHGGIQEYGYPAGLAFAPDGWGVLTESRGTLCVSRDGGKHFRAEPHVARPEVDFAGGASVFRGGIGYVLLTDFPGARLIETRDFGRTWSVVRRWRR